jgi:HSP20 family molecular chaperone IbpA
MHPIIQTTSRSLIAEELMSYGRDLTTHPLAFIHKLASGSSLPRKWIHIPAADIRRTEPAYYFDLEVPGVMGKSSISIQWISSRTFVIEGTISRPNIPEPDDAEYDHLRDSDQEENQTVATDPAINLVTIELWKITQES